MVRRRVVRQEARAGQVHSVDSLVVLWRMSSTTVLTDELAPSVQMSRQTTLLTFIAGYGGVLPSLKASP